VDGADQRNLLAPVQALGNEHVQDGIALCLSGGGYRAMLFHVGALWRLNELGYLAKLDRISSVSGGSITAALLGLRWEARWGNGSPVRGNRGVISPAAPHHVRGPLESLSRG
jgi:NTE family protein